MEIQTKKSAVDLTELAVGIVVLGIVVSVGAVILTNVSTSQVANLPKYQVANETVSYNNLNGQILAKTWGIRIDHILNATDNSVVNVGNYSSTISSTTGQVTLSNSTANGLPVVDWKVSYTVYNVSDARFTLPTNATTGLLEYGNWFKILVIVGISAVVLSLIFMAFGRSNSFGSSEGGTVNY